MWLLEQSVLQNIEQASGYTPTAAQVDAFAARFGDSEGGAPRLLTVAGDVADIAVAGVLTNRPDFFAMLFGGGNTTYPEITAALAAAEQDPGVSRVVLSVDSPGGTIDGLFDTIAALEAATKPITARVSNVAASAAYALAAQADTIEAGNRAARIGSIGIAVAGRIDPTVVQLASTAAPKKRPDLATAAGQAVVVEELDALHELFADAIATGRSTSIENVNKNFGQGATLLAEAARQRGMIDTVAGAKRQPVPTSSETKSMDKATLQAEHPAVYAAVREDGTAAERDRVSAHLILGEASGDMKTALAAAKDGTEMTAALHATYTAAGMNRGDQQAREGDDTSAADAADQQSDDQGVGEVVDLVAAKLGYNPE